jgi:hypothetical protein
MGVSVAWGSESLCKGTPLAGRAAGKNNGEKFGETEAIVHFHLFLLPFS